MITTLVRKMLWGVAALTLLGAAGSAEAQVYYPRELAIKCQQVTNLYAVGTFVFRAGSSVVAGGTLSCANREVGTTKIFQPPSADNWILTISINSATQTVNACEWSESFPPGEPQSVSGSCSAGSAKATFLVKRTSLR